MAGWVFPALKALLPHVGTIIEAAKPVFTRKTPGEKLAVEEQIVELQAAITQNADHIKALAEQLRQTVTVLEQEAEIARDKLKRAYMLATVAIMIAAIALGVALYTLSTG